MNCCGRRATFHRPTHTLRSSAECTHPWLFWSNNAPGQKMAFFQNFAEYADLEGRRESTLTGGLVPADGEGGARGRGVDKHVSADQQTNNELPLLPPCRPTSKQLVTPAPSLQTNRQTPADQQLVAPVPFLQTDIQTTSFPCNPCRTADKTTSYPCSVPANKQLFSPAPCKPTEQLFVPAPASVAKNKKGWDGRGLAVREV